MAKELFFDVETASEVDISEVGTQNYISHPSTKLLMVSWALGDGVIHLWEPDLEPIPPLFLEALSDASVLKLAWNMKMERAAVKKFLGIDIPIQQCFDVMVLARYCSLPGKLKEACIALNLPSDVAKHAEAGDELIPVFCVPVRIGGEITLFGVEPTFFNTRANKPEEWKLFCEYCRQDTFVERYIYRGLAKFMLPQREIDLWYLDQEINERGMPVNMTVVRNGLKMAQQSIETVRKKLQEITKLDNPNSDTQMLAWLRGQGYDATSMNKKVVQVALANPEKLTPIAQEVLLIRKEFKRSSYTKLENIIKRISPDDRLRDCFAYMAASRTGRWAGQDVQFQNLARPDKKVEDNLARVLELIENCDIETAIKEFAPRYTVGEKEYILPSVLGMVVSSLRSIFQAKKGHVLVVSDLSSIENRVLGWLAGCQAILDVFKNNLDAYKAFAVLMYKIAYENVTKEQRQVAKPGVLGLGYSLGPGVIYHEDTDTYEIIWQCDECLQRNVPLDHECKDDKGNRISDLMKTGLLGYAENMGVTLTPEQAYKAWKTFREAYPEVPALWSAVERAAVQTIQTGKKHRPQIKRQDGTYREVPYIEFSRVKRKNGQYILRCLLPSGRYLHYMNARVQESKEISRGGREYTKYSIYYDGIGHGVGATTHKMGWAPVYSYGGKLCLSGDTKVLTNRGILPLTSLSKYDTIYDGKNWINHDGLSYNGEKEVIEWKGIKATHDHLIRAGSEWVELEKTENEFIALGSQLTGLVSGLRLLFSHVQEMAGDLVCGAIVDKSLRCLQERYGEVMYPFALPAVALAPKKEGLNETAMPLYRVALSDKRGFIADMELFPGAIIPIVTPIEIMAEEESPCIKSGEIASLNGSNILPLLTDGITSIWTWIESTITEIMNPETYTWLREKKIAIIEELLFIFLSEARKYLTPSFVKNILPHGLETIWIITSKTAKPQNSALIGIPKLAAVYDILNAGPNHCFTVIGNDGPILVHNCENIVQAISRDILAEGMIRAEELEMNLVGHVHDELISEVKDTLDRAGLVDLKEAMAAPISWAPNLPLGADGFEGQVYHK